MSQVRIGAAPLESGVAKIRYPRVNRSSLGSPPGLFSWKRQESQGVATRRVSPGDVSFCRARHPSLSLRCRIERPKRPMSRLSLPRRPFGLRGVPARYAGGNIPFRPGRRTRHESSPVKPGVRTTVAATAPATKGLLLLRFAIARRRLQRKDHNLFGGDGR